jgi:hypothetical protein
MSGRNGVLIGFFRGWSIYWGMWSIYRGMWSIKGKIRRYNAKCGRYISFIVNISKSRNKKKVFYNNKTNRFSKILRSDCI